MRLLAILLLLVSASVAQIGTPGVGNPPNANAVSIQGKPVDAPTTTGQQPTYNGTKFIQQSKAVIDVRDIAGVDCTGATDSSTALNLLTDGTTHPEVDGRTIELEPCIAQGGIRLNHIWLVQKFSHGVTLHLGPKYGSGGYTLFACSVDSAPTGLNYIPVILFSRIFKPSVVGGFIESFGGTGAGKCGGGGTSTATAGVGVENDYTSNPGGVTTTQGKFEDTLYMPNAGGGTIANWQGIVIGGSSVNSQNLEGMRIIGNWIHGQNSSNSIGVNINGGNSDHGIAQSNTFANLKYAFRSNGPEWVIDSNVTSGVGDYAVFGGGAFFINPNTGGHTVFSNNEHAERSGQFYNTNGTPGSANQTFINNYFGGIDSGALQSGLPNIDCGQCIGHVTFINNRGNNVVGSPIIAPTVSNGSGAIFHDLGNEWSSTPAFPFDVSKSAAYEGLDRRTITNLKLQTIPAAPPTLGDSIAPGTPAIDFLNTSMNSHTASRYLMRGMSSRFSSDSLVISNVTSAGTSSFTIGPKLAGGIVTQAATAMVIDFVQNVGTAGSTTWGYKVVGYTGGGLSNASAEVTTATGNATLTSSNYNRIILKAAPEYWKMCLYRTTGAPTGFIGAVNNNLAPAMTLPGTFGFDGSGDIYLADSGQAVDASGTICPAAVPSSTANGSANIPTGATYQINATQISAANLSNGTTGTAGTAVVLATSPALVTPNIGAATTASQITSTLSTGTAPFSITSTTPVANLTAVPTTYNAGGTQQTAAHVVIGQCTLGTSCAVSFTGSAQFTNATSYACSVADETGIFAAKVAKTNGTAITITGNATDVIDYVCIGN